MKFARTIPTTLIVVAISVIYIFPVLWFVLSSFKPGSELFRLPLSLLPEDWSVEGYQTAWNRFDFSQYFTNTTIVAVVATFLTVMVCAMAGYVFAKFRNKWTKVFFVCILATAMLPGETIMPATFVVVRELGLYNSLTGVIATSILTPTGVFMFRQFFKTVPDELSDAARIDGIGEFRLFFSIMLPLAKSVAVVLGIFSFQWRWNDYMGPLIILRDPERYTLQVALRSIVGADNIDWSVLLSASVISLIPMVVIFIVFQKQIMGADLNAGLKD